MDSHVHYYPHFDGERLIRAAETQLLARNSSGGTPAPEVGVLVLTLTSAEGSFTDVRHRLVDRANAGRSWVSPEPGALMSEEPERKIVFLEGQQVTTREGLEVLAVGLVDRLGSGRRLLDLMHQVGSEGGVAIVPWAAGKWLVPKRLMAITALLEVERDTGWFLGDSRIRPRLFRVPRLFQLARERGWFILTGSDPLPLRGQERHAGSYGFLLHDRLDLDRPLTSFVAALRGLQAQPQCMGERSGLTTFFREQVQLRLSSRGNL